MRLTRQEFSKHVLKWFEQHGRKNLPWQHPNSPYRVWVSEIMLQQTQVATVIPYFEKFIKRFPNLKSLAKAEIDEVLALWSGLGYYARARNLHRTAQIITEEYAGQFPEELGQLQSLPGIGRSTAGAILALSMQKHATILDGNVKRVLARFHAITGWPGEPAILKLLWEYAEKYTPEKRVDDYTQAMMDLGATLCTRSRPKCQQCPLQEACEGYQQGSPTAYPTSKVRKALPVKSIRMLLLSNSQGELLLEKRPPAGIWGGLWSLPECPIETDIQTWGQTNYHCHISQLQTWPTLRHTFSHFHLDIVPVLAHVKKWQPPMMESNSIVWYNIAQASLKGLAAPVRQLLLKLEQMTNGKNDLLSQIEKGG